MANGLSPAQILSITAQNLATGNPLAAFQQGRQNANLLEQQELQNQLLGQRVAQAPLQQESMQLRNQLLQSQIAELGVPDETTAKQFALSAARLALLPDDQVLDAAQNIRQSAIDNQRTTNNIDEFITTFQESPEQGKQLLDSFIGAAESAGLLDSGSKQKIEEQKLKLREQELALKQQTERRQTTKLSAPAEKALLDSQNSAIDAGRNATEFDILANQLEASDLAGGAVSSFEEAIARFLGTQDDATELRRRFNKVRLSEGLKNLPPGPATDRDVQEAFKGVPPENAPATQMVSFLRGAAKMARFDQAWNEFRSEYISERGNTRGLIDAWKVRAEEIAPDVISVEAESVQEDGAVSSQQKTFTSSGGIQYTVE